MRLIPYGETDYVTIRKENSYYVDKILKFDSSYRTSAKVRATLPTPNWRQTTDTQTSFWNPSATNVTPI